MGSDHRYGVVSRSGKGTRDRITNRYGVVIEGLANRYGKEKKERKEVIDEGRRRFNNYYR